MRRPNPEQRTAILAAVGVFLRELVAATPTRWRKVVAAATALALLVLTVLWATETPLTGTQQATALTADRRDVEITIRDGLARVRDGHIDVRDGRTMSVAPLMNWENTDIRTCARNLAAGSECAPMRWCPDPDVPGEVLTDFRANLDEVFSRYGVPYVIACPAGYTLGMTAQTDCGIGDQAVACASYRGTRSGRVSINGNMYRDGRLNLQGVHVAAAHEFGHIFNLGHTGCDNAEPSVMAPLYLPGGPSCAKGVGLTWEDWRDAETFYNLVPGRQGPGPKPTPSPTPSPTPAPGRLTVYAQVWRPAGGGWQITPVEVEVGPEGAYVVVKASRAGVEQTVIDFIPIKP